MAKYLNLDGLQILWTKAKNTFATKSDNHNASDIFNNSTERPSGNTYDVTPDDVVLVQDGKSDTVRRTKVSRLQKNVDENIRSIAENLKTLDENKIDKTDIVQNLSAQNENKVPSQKAVRYVTDLKLNISGSNATAEGTTAILSTLTEVDDKADDYDYYIFGNDDDHTTMHRKPMSKLWDYIKDKIGSVGDIVRFEPKDIGRTVLNQSFIGGIRHIALDSSVTSTTIGGIYDECVGVSYRGSWNSVIVIINTNSVNKTISGFYWNKSVTIPSGECIYCVRHRLNGTPYFFRGY